MCLVIFAWIKSTQNMEVCLKIISIVYKNLLCKPLFLLKRNVRWFITTIQIYNYIKYILAMKQSFPIVDTLHRSYHYQRRIC